MALNIVEWFGILPGERDRTLGNDRQDTICPFIDSECTKLFSDGSQAGVCSVSMIRNTEPVIICPNRLYAEEYKVLYDVIEIAFGPNYKLITSEQYAEVEHDGSYIVGFGKPFGGELRLPSRGGSYFVDWILAHIDSNGELEEFVAIEVQSLDTTGTYKPEVMRFREGDFDVPSSNAGLNWENVNKRILPQLIYKGHVLRREAKCKKGLFFIIPGAVNSKIMERLGGRLLDYGLQPGSITFLWYGLGAVGHDGYRALELEGRFSTTVDQVATAFTSPVNLPEAGVYEAAIETALNIR